MYIIIEMQSFMTVFHVENFTKISLNISMKISRNLYVDPDTEQ